MTQHLFPAYWGQAQGVYAHRTTSGVYGPSNPGETLPDYKARVKEAYGTLRGVSFHDLRDEPEIGNL
jgi:hypothetical protein